MENVNIEAYTKILHPLSDQHKLEIIKYLTQDLINKKYTLHKKQVSLFGALETEKTADELIDEIKKDRLFKSNDIEI